MGERGGGGGSTYGKGRASHVLRQGVGYFVPEPLGHVREPDGTTQFVTGYTTLAKIGGLVCVCVCVCQLLAGPMGSRIRGKRKQTAATTSSGAWAGA
jgi:hypothetical protein